MDQSTIAELIFSPAHARLTGNLALDALLTTLVFTSLVHYGRTREPVTTAPPMPWALSIVIGALYVAEGLARGASRFAGEAGRGSTRPFATLRSPIRSGGSLS